MKRIENIIPVTKNNELRTSSQWVTSIFWLSILKVVKVVCVICKKVVLKMKNNKSLVVIFWLLCLSGALSLSSTNEGFLTVPRANGKEYQIAYRVVRPMALSSQQAAPIVTLHGGPSVPSNYLYPMEDVVPYRSIV